jgi:CHAD domain-containing protein
MIDNTMDFIDSRDVLSRISELEERADLDSEEQVELDALHKLAEKGEGVEDWEDGATLIRDDVFTDYAKDLAEDLGGVPTTHTWPHYCTDWGWAARELKHDYTCIDFDGVTYWVRR